MSLPSDEIHAYLTSNGLEVIPFQGADLYYGYRENEPVFAFIVDGGDGSMAFQKVMGLYWSTAEYISKPWCLVMVTALPMMPHNRQMLDNLGAQYNIPHAAEIGVTVLTTITATCIFFEIIGPIMTKIALTKAGEIMKD